MSDQPPRGKDSVQDDKKPCLCNGICLGKEQLHSNRVCQFDLAFPAVPQEAIAQERHQAEVYRKQMVEAERQRDDDAQAANAWRDLMGSIEALRELPEAHSPDAKVNAYINAWQHQKQRAETAEAERDEAIAEAASLHAEGTLLADQLANANSRLADADLLLGNAWHDVVSIARGKAGVETALRTQVTKLAGDVAVLEERLANVRDAITRLRKWAELSPFAEAILAEAQAALAEEQP